MTGVNLKDILKKRTLVDDFEDCRDELKNSLNKYVKSIQKISEEDFKNIRDAFENRIKSIQKQLEYSNKAEINFFWVFVPTSVNIFHIYNLMMMKYIYDELNKLNVKVRNYIYINEDFAYHIEKKLDKDRVKYFVKYLRNILNDFCGFRKESYEIYEIITQDKLYFKNIRPSMKKFCPPIPIELIEDILEKVKRSYIYEERYTRNFIYCIYEYINESVVACNLQTLMKSPNYHIDFITSSLDRIYFYKMFLDFMECPGSEKPVIYPIIPIPAPYIGDRIIDLESRDDDVRESILGLEEDRRELLDYLFCDLYVDVAPSYKKTLKNENTVHEKVVRILNYFKEYDPKRKQPRIIVIDLKTSEEELLEKAEEIKKLVETDTIRTLSLIYEMYKNRGVAPRMIEIMNEAKKNQIARADRRISEVLEKLGVAERVGSGNVHKVKPITNPIRFIIRSGDVKVEITLTFGENLMESY